MSDHEDTHETRDTRDTRETRETRDTRRDTAATRAGTGEVDLRTSRVAGEALELRRLADETAAESQSYLNAMTEVATGTSPDTAFPVILLALSQTLLAGARLGAITDVVPSRRFEPDPGPDADIDPLRAGLANLLDGIDVYVDLIDPLTKTEIIGGRLSDDLADVAADLVHGLRHYNLGEIDEALWWWQFSYLSTWGVRAASALRVVQSVLHHLRLDVDAETVAEAEFEALHVT